MFPLNNLARKGLTAIIISTLQGTNNKVSNLHMIYKHQQGRINVEFLYILGTSDERQMMTVERDIADCDGILECVIMVLLFSTL